MSDRGGGALGPDDVGVPADRLRMPRAFEPLAAPPVFISGFGRSGTSLTLDLFAGHPEVCAVFETWLLTADNGIAGVLQQPQWHPEYYERRRREIGNDHAAVQLLPYEEAAAELGELVAGWLMRAVQPGQRFLVEKSPLDGAVLAALFPRAKLVHVVRDGRDVATSTLRAADSWAPEMRGEIGRIASKWKARVVGLRGWCERFDRGHEVRFEALRRDPAAVLAELFDFAEIPYDDRRIEAIVESTAPEAYPEEARASGFRGSGEVGNWEASLTRRMGREFDDAAGDLLVELGYAANRDWWRALPRRA